MRLHREWECLRKLACFPLFCGFERLDGARLIEMEYRVKLLGELRSEIVALPLGFGPVDHTDRPLEPRHAQLLHHHGAFVPDNHELVPPCRLEPRLVPTAQRRATRLSF